jgi:hypothetical protein
MLTRLGGCRTCPCGKTPIAGLLMGRPRLSCLDPLPSCGALCSAPMPCGHACAARCHGGPCAPCGTAVRLLCRCGARAVDGTCSDIRSKAQQSSGHEVVRCGRGRACRGHVWGDTHARNQAAMMCDRACRRPLSCGRHKCARVCCPFSSSEAAAVAMLVAGMTVLLCVCVRACARCSGALPLLTCHAYLQVVVVQRTALSVRGPVTCVCGSATSRSHAGATDATRCAISVRGRCRHRVSRCRAAGP